MRRDALPEWVSYTDDGCDVAPRCVECPLEECKYVVSSKQRWELRNGERNALIRAAAASGAKRQEIAAAAGLNLRTIHKLLAEAP